MDDAVEAVRRGKGLERILVAEIDLLEGEGVADGVAQRVRGALA